MVNRSTKNSCFSKLNATFEQLLQPQAKLIETELHGSQKPLRLLLTILALVVEAPCLGVELLIVLTIMRDSNSSFAPGSRM